MNECINLATLLGYAAAILLGLLVLGLLAALIYLARRLRISIRLADGGEKAEVGAALKGGEAGQGAAVGVSGARVSRRPKAKKAAQTSGASRLEVLVGILLIGVAAVAVGLLIGILI